jgi:3-phenylpropionate/trans-cinnamate dioxygenase ferredoxin reductase subunit
VAGVVIVGGGQAGFQTADSLRQEGYDGPIAILGEEPHAPYQRPPLSKAYLLGETDRERLKFRPEAIYAERGIDLRTGVRVEAIDRAAKAVTLAGGERLAYGHMVLATGARVRELPVPGADLAGVHSLKTLDDVDAIEAGLAAVERVCVIGAGFIGLEFAAVARKLGKGVTVLEAAPRVMGRVAAPELSEFVTGLHRAHGVEIVCGAQVSELRGEGGRVAAVACADGRLFDAGLVVVGIGVVPDVALAEAAGLECDNGIAVDGFCRTSDPDIFAAGDCASFDHPFAGKRIRLESVQNAADQGRIVAAAIAGTPRLYDSVPWFWSDQYDVKLQMAGLMDGCDETVVRGDPASGKFSLLHFRQGQFRAVDAISKPADYVQGRKLLEAGLSPTPEQARDTGFKLKDLLG